jgi:hypothetical protein
VSLPTQAWVPRNESAPDEKYFRAVEGTEHPQAKPPATTGFWTSTYDPRTGSGWVQWCLDEEFCCDRANPVFPLWTLEPDPVARIYTVDTYADLEALVAEYPHRRDYPNRGYGAWTDLKPNWEHIARDYDAVHLTEEGQWATRLTHPLDLYGWDCESTLWLRWMFLSATYLGGVRCEHDREAVA